MGTILYKIILNIFGTESVAKCRATDHVRDKLYHIIGVFVLYSHYRTFYSKTLIQEKAVLNAIYGTEGIRCIRAAGTCLHLGSDTVGGSAGLWRRLRCVPLPERLLRFVAQMATSEERTFSSPQSEIRNSYLSKVRTAGCTKYIDVTRGAFIQEINGKTWCSCVK